MPAIACFVSDIDGCLAMPYAPFRMDRLDELVRRTGVPEAPRLSLCSGRSYPYVEAMTQLLRLDTPVLFESGAGMFDPESSRISWHPTFTDDIRRSVDEIRRCMEHLVAGTGMSIDHAKRSQGALVGPDPDELARALERIDRIVRDEHPGFHTFHTHISIDVVPEGLTKAAGLEWLAEKLGIDVSAVAFIGDTNGDIGALRRAGASFAPANAAPDVKEIVDTVCAGNDIDGVLEAFDAVLRMNSGI